MGGQSRLSAKLRPPAPLPSRCSSPYQGSQVLWLGNSYTYYNDLPGMVSQLAVAEGRAVAYSNHTEVPGRHETRATSPSPGRMDMEEAL